MPTPSKGVRAFDLLLAQPNGKRPQAWSDMGSDWYEI